MIKPENLLLIDIETVPLFKTYHELSDKMQQLWDKKSLLLAPYEEDTASSFATRAGIYAEYGKIVCIGLGYFVKAKEGYTLKIKSISSYDEHKILEEFATICNKFFKKAEKQFCGHNIREFDIPYICRRSFINKVPLPDILVDLQHKKPWENPMLDTLQFWKFGEYKNFTSVDLLAAVLEIESPKSDIDGSDVAKVFWQENDLRRIVKYCNRDIVTVGQILMRLNGMDLLKEDEITYLD
jgi:hypothetical protein